MEETGNEMRQPWLACFGWEDKIRGRMLRITWVTHCAELTPLTELVDGVGTPDGALVEWDFCEQLSP